MIEVITFFSDWVLLFLNQNSIYASLFAVIFFLMLVLCLGIGFFVFRSIYSFKELCILEIFLGSFLVGFCCISLLWYIAFCFHIPPMGSLFLGICTLIACFYFYNLKCYLKSWKEEHFFLVIFFLIIFFYYSIPPLTNFYGFTRDYDLTALGILQKEEFILPPYEIESYYPPLVSVISAYSTGILHAIMPSNELVNTNIVMISVFNIAMMLMFVSAYLLGFTWSGKRSTGLFAMIALTFISCSRNAVIGGSTYPALLANLYFFTFLIFLILFLKKPSFSSSIMCGACLAGIFLSHLDIFFCVIWFFVAGGFTFFMWYHPQKRVFFYFMIMLIVGAILIFPYFNYGLENKDKFDKIWTEEKWLAKAKGESHPKSFSEIIFFIGKPAAILVCVGLIICCYHFWTKRENPWLSFLLLLWFICILLQNTWLMLRIAKYFIHIYPLNIIMWMGWVVFVTSIGTYALEHIFQYITQKKIFCVILLLCLFFIVMDYETGNILHTYRPGAGFIWQAIAEKNTVLSSGDESLLRTIAAEKSSGKMLVPDTFAGYHYIVATGKNSTLSFYDAESYHDPSYGLFIENLINNSIAFFNNPVSNNSLQFLDQENISRIFLPAEMGTGIYADQLIYNPSIYNGKYKVILRSGGAKIFERSSQNTSLIHWEAESVSNTSKKYLYPKSIYRVSVPLNLKGELEFPFKPDTCFKKAYLFAVTSPFPMDVTITAGNESITTHVQSAKFQFSEISFVFSESVCGPVTILINSSYYPSEIDWIEVE